MISYTEISREQIFLVSFGFITPHPSASRSDATLAFTVDNRGGIKISDFGISKKVEDSE